MKKLILKIWQSLPFRIFHKFQTSNNFNFNFHSTDQILVRKKTDFLICFILKGGIFNAKTRLNSFKFVQIRSNCSNSFKFVQNRLKSIKIDPKMAHFQLEQELQSALRLDTSINVGSVTSSNSNSNFKNKFASCDSPGNYNSLLII